MSKNKVSVQISDLQANETGADRTYSPQIDVVIPAYKPDRDFSVLISRLMQQTVPVHHIYILQTVEKEGDPLIVTADDKISVHSVLRKNFDHGATRRYGAELASSRTDENADLSECYLLYMTQDAMPKDKKLIEMLLEPFTDEKTAISYARQLVREGGDILERLSRLHNYPKQSRVKSIADEDKLGIQTYFCSDVCALYRQDIYWELGGFVSPTIFNEDMIMAYHVIHAGYQVAYQAEAKVYHSHSYSCMQQFHRNFDLGVSQRQYRDIFESISSEKEGAGYAKKVIIYLLRAGKPVKAFYFALQCGFKLAGYKLGRMYDRLPRRVVLACTMSQGYIGFHDSVQDMAE